MAVSNHFVWAPLVFFRPTVVVSFCNKTKAKLELTETNDWTYACHRPVSASESTNFESSLPNSWTVTVLLSGNCSNWAIH